MNKVIIVDDHFLIREGITKILNNSRNYEVVNEASDGNEALNLIEIFKCDLLITDYSMPNGMDGLTLISKVKQKFPKIKCVLLTMFVEETDIYKAVESKCDGMISKDGLKNELINVLELIMKGERYYVGKSKDDIREIIKLNKISNNEDSRLLSKREMEILKLVANGKSSQNIADELFISKRTVDAHRYRIMDKLKLKTLPDLIIAAIKLTSENQHRK